jgi:hypothetical protein
MPQWQQCVRVRPYVGELWMPAPAAEQPLVRQCRHQTGCRHFALVFQQRQGPKAVARGQAGPMSAAQLWLVT